METLDYRSGFVRDIPKDVDDTRTIPFVASTYSRDAHGTVLNQAGWDLRRFNDNPIIGYQHNVYGDDFCNKPDPDDVIGSGVAKTHGFKMDRRLDIDVTFEPEELNAQADKIFRKVKFGTLRAGSVGFLETGQGHFGQGDEREGGSNQTWYMHSQNLLEFSVVNLPSNPEALVKSVRDMTTNALHYIHRVLGISYGDIDRMTVGDVIRELQGGNKQEKKTSEDLGKTIEEEASSAGQLTVDFNVNTIQLDQALDKARELQTITTNSTGPLLGPTLEDHLTDEEANEKIRAWEMERIQGDLEIMRTSF